MLQSYKFVKRIVGNRFSNGERKGFKIRNMNKGTLYWLTGLSGAGKTTIGTLLYKYLKEKKDNVIFFDGDLIREVYQNRDYSFEGRKKLTYMHIRLCKMLVDQGIDIVGCHIAMYDECRNWNKCHIENYKEIYLKVDMEELIRRDQKQLYSRAMSHEITNVMGVDLPFEEPKNPDLIIYNNGKNTPQQILKMIVNKFNL